jgi:riboflavin kinase/FMN adenylyltransferase
MLGRPSEVRGKVQRGDERGRTIGFPTANIPVSKQMAWPSDGVYAGWYTRPDGERHPCALNIGRRPTFYEHAQQSLLEAHLLDFEGDLYGEEARVEFVDFLRSEHRFSGIDALAAQLKKDIEHARAILRV